GLTWGEFERERPELAKAGRELLSFYGPGLAFLSTVRPDGGPRLHPIAPLITDEALFGFLIPSPKLKDLRRDGRYALHSYGLPENEDAFYVTGGSELVEDPRRFEAAAAAFRAQPGLQGIPSDFAFAGQTLVEF